MQPPAREDRVRWPEAFGTRFTVFVDTEEEFDWSAPLSRDNRSVTATAAIPQAHRWFAGRGVPLTYMVDHPIVSDARSVDVLREVLADPRAAVGTQLHPWVNPPFDEVVTPANSFVGNLPRDLEAAKLAVLTQAIEDAFGVRPVSYRAGRYGLGPHSFELLAAAGYRLDSSMRPRYAYTDESGPDFGRVDNHAFRRGGLIELPLTTVFTGAARAGGNALYRALGKVPRGRGIASRLRLLSRVALTPEGMPLDEALEAIRVALGEGVRVLNFSFHSPSLVPGHTPYVRDAAALAAFHAWWDAVFALLAQRGVASASLAEILGAEVLEAAG